MLCNAVPSACHNLAVLSSAADAMRPLANVATLQYSAALLRKISQKLNLFLPMRSHVQKHQKACSKCTHGEL